ncbi:unnamed protein product [Enterobius vermicularis]|uniref:Acyl_transf_3 domain-containing protein n=1 Tax=Enterobius vermicularis TaxID=51028 RepID=A0A0N4VQX3_ENTVE|nr:unnamed protein product [Enterobius vermicularis]
MITDNEEMKDHATARLATIYVLAFHLHPQVFPSNFLGVDIFFVISGYLITMIFLKQKSFTLKTFLFFDKKRVKRTFSAYFHQKFLNE